VGTGELEKPFQGRVEPVDRRTWKLGISKSCAILLDVSESLSFNFSRMFNGH